MIGQWFNEAKQSLTVAGPICTEANNLVQTSRKEIEQATTLWAQIVFMHEAITEQIHMLHNVHNSVKEFQTRINTELNEGVSQVEQMHRRLTSNLDRLSKTRLDQAFSSTDKTLRSFVFEDGLQQLEAGFKSQVSRSRDGEKELSKTVDRLKTDIDQLVAAQQFKQIDKSPLEQAHQSTDRVAEHAHAMAELLESLTRHYDQCLQAIEMQQHDAELVEVLEKDSREVPGVVAELHDRRKSIKQSSQSVSQFKTQMKQLHRQVVEYFGRLDEFCVVSLPQMLDLFEGFSRQQKDNITQLTKLNGEISSLVDYYHMFYQAYQAMVLEVMRRGNAESAIQTMAQEMANKLKQAYDDEMEKRQTFIRERGDFLPSDLWSGLTQTLDAPHVQFEKSAMPRLSEDTIQAAVKFT